ncbi:MAG: hypothetical protein H3C32_00365 [Anaerolineae bacterium]|nr:hypothetical protein [Anaerolineae bacterium]
MVDILFELAVTGESSDNGAWLDPLEIDLLLESTRRQIETHIHNRLDGIACDIHGETPRVIVRGGYDLATEELNVGYDVQACCNLMIMKSAALLGR